MPRQIAVRELDGWRDPEAVFLRLGADPELGVSVWLDGGVDATSGRSIIATSHLGSQLIIPDRYEDPELTLDELRERLSDHAAEFAPSDPSSALDPDERTALGWIGWVSYEFGARRLGVPVTHGDDFDAAWIFVDRAVVFDHARRIVRLEWLPSKAADAWAARTAQEIGELGETSAREPAALGMSAHRTSRTDGPAEPQWRHDADEYARLIAACQAAITRGDAYQLCLTNRVDVDVTPDPLETYLRLRRSSPTHHGGFLRFGSISLLSASPEQFLLVERDGRVSTRPMKGTRPRGATPGEDDALRRELAQSDKERAENLMIVDLMRNDLARVAELGSVNVPVLLETETYPHVHQLVSTVAARLKPGLTAVDALAAAFPAGSMTGAPKISAMRILHELEQGPRGAYSGVFGSLAVDGSADFAMIIRSIVLSPRGASVGTGGGITALSEVQDEIEETRIKARALLAVLTGRARAPIQ